MVGFHLLTGLGDVSGLPIDAAFFACGCAVR
jgi:hypothetical protein